MKPKTEPQNATASTAASASLLAGWITRKTLATELNLTVDTLGRWEARRFGPPCVRAGRMVLYRRSAVQDWLTKQEQARPARAGRGRT